MTEKLDPQVSKALEALRTVPPRDPERAAQGRMAFLAEAQRLADEQRNSSLMAVSFGPWARLKGWIRRQTESKFPRKEGFAMPSLILAAIAALSLLFGGGALTVKAADAAAPGDVLYPVDLAVENVRLALAVSPEQQAELRLAFAQERLEEIQALLQEGKVDQVDVALENMEAHLATAAQLAAEISRQGQAEAVRQMEERMARSAEALQKALAQAPDPARPALQHALLVSTQVREQVRHMEEQGGADTFHLQGTVEAVSEDSLTVNGVTVQIAPETVMSQEVQVGDTVSISGLIDPTANAWVALKVAVSPSVDREKSSVSFEGTVESVGEGEIVVDGQVVRLGEQTRVKGDLEVGATVSVKAEVDESGALVAINIQVRAEHGGDMMGEGRGRGQENDHLTPSVTWEPGDGRDHGQGDGQHRENGTVELMGMVSAADLAAGQIVVNGSTIYLTADTKVEGQIQTGSLVEVKAVLNEDGTLTAVHIEVKAGQPGQEGGHEGKGGHEGEGGHRGGFEPTSTPDMSGWYPPTATPDMSGWHSPTATPDMSGWYPSTPTPDMDDDGEHEGGHEGRGGHDHDKGD